MQRMTRQKRILNEEVKKFTSFFDAYELHSKVSQKDKRIGRATVYRFLTNAENTGHIHSFMCANRKIYSNSTTNHAHFTCEQCGKVKHIKVKNVDFLSGLLTDEICHFQIELAGTCMDCKEKI